MEIWREFTFSAAHRLPRVPEAHKCHRMHGHNYRVRVTVARGLDLRMGWVCDFADIVQAFEPIRKALDHQCLNDHLENPTSENLAVWLWARLLADLPGLVAVEVSETDHSGAIYRGP